jgi:hypothetical protein
VPKTEISWNGGEALKRQRAGGARGLLKSGEFFLGQARPLTPIEEGDLERSGTATVDASQQKTAIAFDRPYAVDQHENLAYEHDEGRQAKYLEEPIMDPQNQATAAKIIAAEIRRELS